MLSDKIHIQEVGLNDLDALRDISIQTFTETFSEHNSESDMKKYVAENLSSEKLKHELATPGSVFYFALSESHVIGYLKINTGKAQTENHNPEGFEIERIYVLKSFHGKRVGKLLFDKARSIALERKHNSIWLGVWEKNTRAIAFYIKQGFIKFDQHIFKLGDDEQTDIMMKLDIGRTH